ncbi:MAG TPA: zinc-ribbon domain-containing protein [Thermodesulfobacteriota bacterium]|nr:zinc-ribbon domain-containing protein [Thermodesulfobacteriota bacterium]
MIVQCKKCKARYKMDDRRVKTTGSKVRCSKCGHVFFVMVEEESNEELNSRPEEGFSSSPVYGGKDKTKLKDNPDLEQKESKVNEHLSHEGLKNGSAKGDEDTFNWEGLLNLSRDKAESSAEASQGMKSEKVLEDEREGDSVGFSWENLSVDKEIEEPVVETPKLFSDTADEELRNNPLEYGLKPEHDLRPERHTMDMFSVDTENLPFDRESAAGHNTSLKAGNSAYFKSKRSSSPSPLQERLKKAVSTILVIVIVIIMVLAGIITAMNLELIPKDKADKINSLVLSKLPIEFLQTSADVNLMISDQAGRWISTRNGYIYVVYGNVANKSEFIVNYIKLRSEFMSGGKKLFQQAVYAGNTFTEEELETLSFEEIEQRLNTKKGDIDFYNHRKLAGLNYNIQPGESVPFFTVFPAESKVLGLKYEVDIMDFEKVELK